MHADRRRRASATGILASVIGLALFWWFIARTGAAEIWANVSSVGFGLALIFLIAGGRFAARALAWTLCLEPPHRLPLRHAFAAVVCGDTFGNLTPLGPIVGEPAKIAYVRDTVPVAPALTALAIENLIYTLSAAAMIAASMIALVLAFTLPPRLRDVSELVIAALLAAFVIAVLVLWRRPAIVSRTLSSVLPGTAQARARVDRVRAVETEIYSFAARRRTATAALAGLEALFHALGVLEVHVTWWLMTGSAPPLLTSFVLEGANRVITVLFKVVPLRLGVDEMGTAAFTQALGFGAAPGGSLAIVRKARILLWTIVGTALLVRRGLSPQRVLRDSQVP